VNGQNYGGSYGCSYVIVNPAPFPTLVANGINGCFVNHHLKVNAFPSWMKIYIKGASSDNLGVAGIYPNGNHGRLIVQGPDQDYHAFRGSASGTTGANQYQILLNQLDFLAAKQAGITWTGPNGFTSNDASPFITNVTSANAGTYTATLTNITGGGCSTSRTTTVVINAKPTITDFNNITQSTSAASCNAIATFSPTITNASTVNYTLSGATTGSGSATGSGSNFNLGITTVTAIGSCGTTIKSITVTVVDDIAPTVLTQNKTIYPDASGAASITTSDINNGSSDICSIASYALDKTSFDCSNVGSNTVTLTVTDVNGNSNTGTAAVTVTDAINPTVTYKNISKSLLIRCALQRWQKWKYGQSACLSQNK